MGAVFVSSEIHDAFMNGPEHMIEFMHGYTYSGNPIAAAAGLATLETYREEGLFDRARDIAPYWEEGLHSLKDLPNVIDIRSEEHTSELQSLMRISYAVFCLKKKNKKTPSE